MANLATINNNLLADSGIDPLSVVLGSGTANQIAYWIDADNIGALTTATYPSLTELSYVKGVTSSIQTQLNGKQPLLTNPVTGTGSAGQVAYWSSSSAITGESAFYYDATNNWLGIGRTPTAPVDVFVNAGDADKSGGGIAFLRYEVSGDYRGSAIFHRYVTGGGNDAMLFSVSTSTNPYISGTTALNSNVKMLLNADGRLLINSFVDDGTNILQVSGSGKFTGNVIANRMAIAATIDTNVRLVIGEDDSTTNVGYIRLRGYDVYEGNIYKTATYGIYMDTDTNARPIRIDGSAFITGITGNVLIGTTVNAGYKTDISGTLRNTTSAYFATSSGSVSIGTTVQASLLHVNGDINIAYDQATTNFVGKTFASGHVVGNRGAIMRFGLNDATFTGMSVEDIASSVAGYNSQFIDFYTHEGYIWSGIAMRIGTLGSIRFNRYGAGSFTGTPTYRLAVDASGNVIEVTDGGGTVTGSGTATRVAFWDSSSSITSSSGLFWDNVNGRLAVGKNSADARLEVYGSTKGQIRANGGPSMGSGIDLYTELSGTGRRNWGIYTEVTTAGDFSILCSNTAGTAPVNEVFTIQNTGVGSYKYALNVVGDLSTSAKLGAADNNGLFLRGVSDITHKLYYTTSAPAGIILEVNNDFRINYYNSGTPVTKFTFSTGGNFTATAVITGQDYISNAIDNGLGEYYFFRGNAAVSNALTIYNYDNNIYNNAYRSYHIRSNNTGGSGGYIFLHGSSIMLGAADAPVLHSGTRGVVIKGSARGILELWDATTGKSVFQNVSGDTYIGQLDKGTGNGHTYLLVNGDGSSADVALTLFSDKAATFAYSVTTTGNVGVRTAASTASDTYLKTADAGIAYQNTYFGTGSVRIGGGSDHVANTVLSVAPGVVNFDRPGVVGGALKIHSDGKVGINATANAGYNLDVGGTQRITETLYITRTGSNTVGSGACIQLVNQLIMQANANSGVDFWTLESGTWYRRVTLNNLGRLGIGDTDPQSGLRVSQYGSKWDTDSQYNQPSGNIFLSLGYAVQNQDSWFGMRGNYGSSSGSANLLLQANYRDVNSQAGHYVASVATSLGNADFAIGKLVTQTSVSTPPAKVEQFRIVASDGTVQIKYYAEVGRSINATQYNVLTENQLYRTDGGDLYINSSGTGNVRVVEGGAALLVNTGTRWNQEKFGIQISNPAAWTSVPSMMRLTNYGSGYATKITFTDSSIIDGIFGMIPAPSRSYFVMGFSGHTEQGFKVYNNGYAYVQNRLGVNVDYDSLGWKFQVADVGAIISGGEAISTSTMKGVMIENTNNGTESVGLWFRTGSNHLSGISAQRTTDISSWSTDLRFYTHPNATSSLTSAFERVRITSEGELWVGYTSDQGAYLLQVNGSTYSSSGFFESSDIRLKTILNRHQSTDFDAIEYNWNDGRDSKLHWGYAAQEVMKVLPDAVNGSEELFYTLDYNQVHTYKIAMLEKRIAELEQQLKNK